MKKILLSVFAVLCLICVCGFAYLLLAFPSVEPAPDISVAGTPQQIERGEYLAHHVAACMDCHSNRVWTKFTGPIKPGSMGRGGDVFNEEMGFPGTFYAKNITPYNLKDWTDGEIYRLITTGVTKDGSVIFPVMPYPSFGKMAPADVKAIIAYIRTLEPIAYEVPESEADFPMSLIMRTFPRPADPMVPPEPEDIAARGKYLITIAGCSECHTQKQQGQLVEGMYLAGGFEFRLPSGTVRSANITPDKETGIGRWSKEYFINRFKQYEMPFDSIPEVPENGFNTVMPWTMFAGMKEEDLEAIYTYLQTVEPVKNSVVKFTPAGEQ